MAVSRDDQTTALMIIAILIVSVIAIVAVSNIVWNFVKGPASEVRDVVSKELHIQRLNYNFKVDALSKKEIEQMAKANEPQVQEEDKGEGEVEEQKQEPPQVEESQVPETSTVAETPVEYDFNFSVPEGSAPTISVSEIQKLQSFPDAIIEDAKLANFSAEQIPQGNIRIRIPKLNVDSPVLQGFDAENLLKQGFWIYPGSYELGKGEVVMLCHRRYWGPWDPRSCWFLDQVYENDEIYMYYNGNELKYQVVGRNMFEGDDPLIYTISPDSDYIKISTCAPLYSNEYRLVVLAKRVK